MADRSTGPVKPPVIDLTARSGARADNDTRPSEAASSTSSRPLNRGYFADANWPLLAGGAVAGAVLGTLLTYLLGSLVPLPTRPVQMPPDLSAEVTTQGEQITTLTQQLGTLGDAGKKTQVSLDATIAQLDGDIGAVNKSIADLKASIPAAQAPIDLTPLETEIKTLKAQVDAIGAGASGGDASAIAQSLADVQTGLTSLTTRLNGVDQTVAALRTDLDAARKPLRAHIAAALPTEAGPAMKLPLILSGLESAFETGRPFQTELDALLTLVPDISIPTPLAAAAGTGLGRPATVTQQFEAALPDMLAARDHNATDWAQGALDWAKSLLALRPAQEQEGDSPDAVISRLEGAVGRHDYAAASSLVAPLPAA